MIFWNCSVIGLRTQFVSCDWQVKLRGAAAHNFRMRWIRGKVNHVFDISNDMMHWALVAVLIISLLALSVVGNGTVKRKYLSVL